MGHTDGAHLALLSESFEHVKPFLNGDEVVHLVELHAPAEKI